MQRWIVTVAWLLLVALPLQAWAACSGCPGHAGQAPADGAHRDSGLDAGRVQALTMDSAPCHGDAPTEGAAASADLLSAAGPGLAHAQDAAPADADRTPDASSCDGCDGCPTCAAGHGSATGPMTAEALAGQARSPAPAPAASTDAPAFLTPGPDRPPRSVLA